METKTLERGGLARVYRPQGGFGDCQGAYNVPVEGAFVVRDLPPGDYVARDEQGTEVAFVVLPTEEESVVFGAGEPSGGTGGPGDSDPHAPKDASDKPGEEPEPEPSDATLAAQARQTGSTSKEAQARPGEGRSRTREAVGQGIPNTEVTPEGAASNTGDGERSRKADRVAKESSVAAKSEKAGTAAAARKAAKKV
jgi:hypothetical protein